MGYNDLAVAKGIETIKIAVAIALAIVCTFSLPAPVLGKLSVVRKKS